MAFADRAPVGNEANKLGEVLLGSGASERFDVKVPVGTKQVGHAAATVHLAGVALAVNATPLAFEPIVLSIDAQRTADEN